ncbi:outer membrane beta-barrel protein [Flavilitoribacter nigricans]|uniref:Outer membrane protein beta-barrel domain-containing protein n=1 Tax=Flavilitoribacter nigricans (strain ATCC 23147 / DSM 23189 / NBRC 102662 / NCIMB 1420 / SS-2) TaxID=1122177 RepID=A0A2D0MXH8_FLAN2|nr:outer membrane beta-barrel protein [Flavilitoribacter nigricans]PHN00982.1 hypothetical protein CRP01_39480 [Flavilitoribacter nigricans DSM 23189 = NBRC 102662]
MKKLVSLLCFLLAGSGVLLAQFNDQGNFLIGSTLGFSTAGSRVIQNVGDNQDEGEGPSSTQLSISPKIGYFIVDNFALGLGMDYTLNEVDQPNNNKVTDTDLLFGPFARYFLPLEDDIALMVETTFGFGRSSDTQDIGGQIQNIGTNIFAFGIGPGITVISDSGIGISAVFKYNYARSEFDTNIDNIQRQTITRTNAFDFSIGFQYYFGGLVGVGESDNQSPSRSDFYR